MTKDQKVNKAIALVQEADDKCREAMKLLGPDVYARLAAEDLCDGQYHLLDAITHMQSRPLKKRLKKGLTTAKRRV